MNKKALHIEQHLVLQLKAGNEGAFEQLFNTYQNDVFRYTNSLVKSKELAQELVQEVFIKVWVKRGTLKAECSFKSFLFTIAKNMSFDLLAKASRDLKLKEQVFYHRSESHTPIENQILNKEYELLRQQAINRLPPKRRRIFEMSRNEGKSYKDISSELGITTQTVKNQMSQALGNISVYLESYGGITLALAVLLVVRCPLLVIGFMSF